MGGFRVGIEIPLLSWSLHLLGEAEWAGGGRVSGPRGFSMARPPLSFHSSVEGCAVVGGSESRWGVLGCGWPFRRSAVFEAFGLRPRSRAKLFRDPIRAEDSVRWGV